MHEEIHTQVEKVTQGSKNIQDDQFRIFERGNDIPVVPPDLNNSDAFAQAVTTKVNWSMVPKMNVVESSMTSRLRDYVRINPLIFIFSKVGEDPQEFVDGVSKC